MDGKNESEKGVVCRPRCLLRQRQEPLCRRRRWVSSSSGVGMGVPITGFRFLELICS